MLENQTVWIVSLPKQKRTNPVSQRCIQNRNNDDDNTQKPPHSPSSTTTTTTQVIPGGDPFANDDPSRSLTPSSISTTTQIQRPWPFPPVEEQQQQALEEECDPWLVAKAER